MTRKPREKSSTNVYHVLCRGRKRIPLFRDDADYTHYLETLAGMLEGKGGELIAYCLTPKQVNLLVRMDMKTLPEGMRRLNSTYAAYYNRRYQRTGALFRGSFASEPVEGKDYLLAIVRHIHTTPARTGLGATEDYPQSSYKEYLGAPGFCSTRIVLDAAGSKSAFEELHAAGKPGSRSLADGPRMDHMTDEEARTLIADTIGMRTLKNLPSMKAKQRDPYLADMLRMGLSIRQVERITGVGRGVTQRISLEIQDQ